MADSRGTDSRNTEPVKRTPGLDPQHGLPVEPQPCAPAARPCPECANPGQTLVSEGDVVAIYRCPICGHLSAPVKER
jgi:hypothetical protein